MRILYVRASQTDFDDRSLRVFCNMLAFHKGQSGAASSEIPSALCAVPTVQTGR